MSVSVIALRQSGDLSWPPSYDSWKGLSLCMCVHFPKRVLVYVLVNVACSISTYQERYKSQTKTGNAYKNSKVTNVSGLITCPFNLFLADELVLLHNSLLINTTINRKHYHLCTRKPISSLRDARTCNNPDFYASVSV